MTVPVRGVWSTVIGSSDDPLALRSLFRLGPAPADHGIAIRCALGVFLPMLTLLALGRLDVSVFAVFAAFTNIYGRVPNHVDRLLAQLKVGASFWVLMLAGWLAASVIPHGTLTGLWVKVGLTSLVAAVAAGWAGALRIRPAGSLFHIFCFAAIISGPPRAGLGDSMLAASATVALALLLGQAGRLFPSRRTPWVVTPPTPLREVDWRGVGLEAAVHGLAALFAGALTIPLAPALGAGHHYWAMVAAVVPLAGHSTRHRVARGVHRILGTFSGIVLLVGIMALQPPLVVVALLMAACQYGAELFIARNYFFAQTFVTPLALLGTSMGAGWTAQLAYDRIVETIIGSCVGMAGVLTISLVRSYVRRLADPDDPVSVVVRHRTL